MSPDEALALAAAARAGRIATVRPDGTPHVVPLVFALVVDGDRVRAFWAVDRKPKRSRRLARLENLRANPAAEIVVDAYREDWSALWWVRLSGSGRIVDDPAERAAAIDALADKYQQYRDDMPDGDVVAIDVNRIEAWSAAEG